MKTLYSVVLFGLVAVALAKEPPHHDPHKGDHVKEEFHPGVDSNLHFKDGEHDADYDHKAFLDKEKEGKIPEEAGIDDDDDDDDEDDDFDDTIDGQYDDKFDEDYNYDGYNGTYEDYPEYNDTAYDYNGDYNDYNDTDYPDYNDTMDYDYPKNYDDDDWNDGTGGDDGDGYDDGMVDDTAYDDELADNPDTGGKDDDKIDEKYDDKRKKRDVGKVNNVNRNGDVEEMHTEGSEDEADEFKDLEPEEAKRRLLVLAKRMDKDKSGDVSKEEMVEWISNSFKSLDEADARKQFEKQDKDKNGQVTWNEMLQEVYGYTPEEVAQHENDTSDEMKNFVQMTKDDRKKFDLADQSKDGTLDFKEFVAYHNPHNYAHMAPIEIEKTMREYDKDKDGKITFAEYQQKDEKKKEGDEDLKDDGSNDDHEEMQKQFKSYDKNGDGHLDDEEVKAWVIPAMDELAIEESTHLLTEADKNKDGKLTMDEITEHHDLFVGSQATDYGDALHKVREEL